MATNISKRNNVRTIGEGGKTMIFGHGFGCDQNMWRFITPAFKQDYKIVLFDYVGSGGSDLSAYNPERYASLQGYAQDLIEICQTLNIRNAVFVGHSVSSMVGLLASLYSADFFSRIIMIGPSPCYVNGEGYEGGFSRRDIEGLLETMDKNYIGWANFLAPAVMANADRPELSEELTQSFCSTDPVIARRFAEVTFFSDNRKDLKNIRVPSLIMQCTEDIIAPLSIGEYMNEHMPQSTLVVMKATGHCPHLSAPEETIALIKNYLALPFSNN